MKKMFLLMALASTLLAEIYEVSSIEEMDKYKEEGVLFLYDIDNTLIALDQMLGSDQWFGYRYSQFLQQKESKQEALDAALAEWTSIQYISGSHEVEEGSSKIIRSQQEEGVMLIGFTTRGLSLSKATVRQLSDIGVDFSLTAPVKHDLLFRNSQSIIFRNGVLFTAGTHKGSTLFDFLDQMEILPKKVVFINDKQTHLRQIEETCEERGVDFVGLRYNYLDDEVASFDPKIADVQLERYFNILSDEEAASLLK